MDAILFDWDGTLADTLGAIYDANVAVMAELGLPFDAEQYRRHATPDWRLFYERLGVPADRLEAANARWNELIDFRGALLFPGIRQALKRLSAAGHPLGVVTAGHSSAVRGQLRQHGLERLFEVVVYGDDLPVQKPHPDPLLVALGGLGRRDRPDRAVYVGDSTTDMEMARAVGVHAVGIESLFASADQLRAAGADEVAGSTQQWVEQVFSRGSVRPSLPPGTRGSPDGSSTPLPRTRRA